MIEDALVRWYFNYIECIFEIFCHIVYAFWEKNNVRSCLHISYQKRVGGFHCVWFCTLFFPPAITVFLFCSKSCCWRRKKTKNKWAFSSSLPKFTQVLWREETWQSPTKSTAELLLTWVGPGFHSRSPVLHGRCLTPLKDAMKAEQGLDKMASMQKVRHCQVACWLQGLKLDRWGQPRVCRESDWCQWDALYALGGWPHSWVKEGRDRPYLVAFGFHVLIATHTVIPPFEIPLTWEGVTVLSLQYWIRGRQSVAKWQNSWCLW